IDGSLPPMGFRQFHTLDLTDWRGAKRDERTAELLHSVERRLRAKGKDIAPIPSLSRSKRRFAFRTGKVLWALAAMLVIVVAVGGGLIFQNFRSTKNAPSKP